MTTFTPIEIQLIEREMQGKSAADIAFLLDAPVDDVKAIISNIASQSGIATKQATIDQREASRSLTKPVRVKKPKKEAKPKEFTRMIDNVPRERKNFLETRTQYKTKAVDYTQKKLVKIDRNTWVYVNDPAELSAEQHKYFQNIKNKTAHQSDELKRALVRVKHVNT